MMLKRSLLLALLLCGCGNGYEPPPVFASPIKKDCVQTNDDGNLCVVGSDDESVCILFHQNDHGDITQLRELPRPPAGCYFNGYTVSPNIQQAPNLPASEAKET